MHNTLRSLLVLAALGVVNSLTAQVTLENFSSFQSTSTLFYGDWSNTGDPFSGDTSPIASFTQGAGVYNFSTGSNADSAYVERTFASSLNLTGNTQLSLTARLLDGNTADSLTVFLLDSSFNVASATFLTSGFTAGGFTTQTLLLTADPSFAFNAVTSFRISGNDPFAGGTVSIATDNLAVSGARVITPVPEASTYGLFGAAALGLAVFVRRQRRVA